MLRHSGYQEVDFSLPAAPITARSLIGLHAVDERTSQDLAHGDLDFLISLDPDRSSGERRGAHDLVASRRATSHELIDDPICGPRVGGAV
jgi:hypothetical protein